MHSVYFTLAALLAAASAAPAHSAHSSHGAHSHSAHTHTASSVHSVHSMHSAHSTHSAHSMHSTHTSHSISSHSAPTGTSTGAATSTGTATSTGKLNPSCAPGGNFDLSNWKLQLPIGKPKHPETILGAKLNGCANGYEDANHTVFYTEKGDGAMVMKVSGSPDSTGCVTTANSKHCRTELRESNPEAWDPKAATNRLSATLAVPKPDDSHYGTVVGQVHINDTVSSKPVCELYYNAAGVITMGVEHTIKGGNQNYTVVGHAKVGSTFSYMIAYEKNELSVSINGGKAQTLSTFDLDAPSSYFKAGNYNQGNSSSEVHFFSIKVEH